MTAEQNKTEKPVVLLATQSRLSARSMIKLLQAQFHVLEVDDAESAWEALTDSTTVNLLISDLSLMDDQFGLLERIKTAQDKSIRHLSSLLLIAENDDDSDRESALMKGANDFLTMPFSSAELIARVRMHTQVFLRNEKILDAEKDETIDVLQQLAPESFFESRLEQELSFSTRHKIPVSSCKIEVNKLDFIEQQYGHKTAHQVIKLFAKILQKIVRREDTLCYSGHGRFTVLYPATNALGALTAIKRIQAATDKTQVKLGDKKEAITFSGAIYTSLASEAITPEGIQNELEKRLKEALIKGANEIVSVGNKDGLSNRSKLSVQRALTLIEANKTDELGVHSKELMTQVIPLLRFSDKHLNLGMEKVIESLIQRLNKRS